jgi:hypothetical protein
LKLRACKKKWSERRDSNPQQPVWKTGTQPFEFRSLKIKIGASGKTRTFAATRTSDSFTDCLPYPSRDQCVKNKIFCVKMKKAEI